MELVTSVNEPKLKILFFLPSLGGGGAEMNAVRLANHLGDYGIISSFALCRGGGKYQDLLSKDTKVHVLDTGSINSSTLQLFRSRKPLKKLIEQEEPDIICPIMYGSCLTVLSIVRSLNFEKRYIVALSIQNSPKAQIIDQRNFYSMVVLALMKKLYPRADTIIALSQGVAKELGEIIPDINNKISVIPNIGSPISKNQLQTITDMPDRPRGKLVVACGRLVEQKGYPYLLKAFAKVVTIEDAYLWILGEGKLKKQLEQLCQSLHIQDRVNFLGFLDNPQAYMAQADIFVLSSLWEGFGNVILEAMEVGVPVIATDCPHGPAEIIENGISGILVPPANETKLAEVILMVLNDPELQQNLSITGKIRAEKFSPAKIAGQYAEVFRYTLLNKNVG